MTLFEYLAELVLAQFEDRTPPELPENITMDDLITIATKSHMSTLILGALLKLPLDETLEPKLRQYLLNHILNSYTQQNEFKMLIQTFEKNGIRTQPMKGIFMKQLYPKPELREMSDIDILISEEQLSEAEKLIKELGYQFYSKESHHDIYTKGQNMVLEVHWTMYDSHVDQKQHDYFHNFSKAVLLQNHAYTYTFTKEDFYVFMMAHMAKHFYARGCGIRNLVDIYVYQKAFGDQLDNAYIKKELKNCGIYDFSCHMETLATLWLNRKECPEFYLQLFHYMLDSGIYGKDENGIWNKFAYAKAGNKENTAFKLKLWYYFPPMYYMEEYYPFVKGRPYLLPVGWMVRFFHGVLKKKGTSKLEFLKTAESEEILVIQNIYKKMGLRFSQHEH